MKNRIGYIDMSKGLAIILVIIGHSSFVPNNAKLLLYSFHIPLFFFLSGFTLNVRKYETFSGYCLNKVKSLVIPFFLLNSFVFLFQLFVMYPDQVLSFDILHFIKQLLISDRLHIYFQLWFLNVMFLAHVFSYFILKRRWNLSQWVIIILSLLVLVYLGQKVYEREYYLIWNIDLVPVALIFILLGVWTKNNLHQLEKYFSIYLLPIGLILTNYSSKLNYRVSGYQIVDLYYQQIGNHFLFYLAAISGIWSVLIFFKTIPESSILKSIGQKTLIYYGVHSPIVLVLVEKLVKELSTKYTGIFVNQYITTNLVVPPYLKKEALSGRALVRLIIERDGTLSNISIVKPFSPTLDRNIVALLRRMPKWSPARQEGRPVRSFCFIPVNVKLQ